MWRGHVCSEVKTRRILRSGEVSWEEKKRRILSPSEDVPQRWIGDACTKVKSRGILRGEEKTYHQRWNEDVSSQVKRRHILGGEEKTSRHRWRGDESTEILFYEMMLGVPWSENVINNEVLMTMEAKRQLILRKRKSYLIWET